MKALQSGGPLLQTIQSRPGKFIDIARIDRDQMVNGCIKASSLQALLW